MNEKLIREKLSKDWFMGRISDKQYMVALKQLNFLKKIGKIR